MFIMCPYKSWIYIVNLRLIWIKAKIATVSITLFYYFLSNAKHILLFLRINHSKFIKNYIWPIGLYTVWQKMNPIGGKRYAYYNYFAYFVFLNEMQRLYFNLFQFEFQFICWIFSLFRKLLYFT